MSRVCGSAGIPRTNIIRSRARPNNNSGKRRITSVFQQQKGSCLRKPKYDTSIGTITRDGRRYLIHHSASKTKSTPKVILKCLVEDRYDTSHVTLHVPLRVTVGHVPSNSTNNRSTKHGKSCRNHSTIVVTYGSTIP